MPTLANHKFNVQFTGHTAHAAVAPWQGVNALDAAVLAYNGISVLRQQLHPSNRIHCIISDGGLRPNVIPGSASLDCYIRCPTLKGADELLTRVKKCFEGAALQSGCDMEFKMHVCGEKSNLKHSKLTRHRVNTYADLRSNKTICSLYAEAMAKVGSEVKCDFNSPGVPGSTDQGTYQVSHVPTILLLAEREEQVTYEKLIGNVTYECPGIQAYVGVPAEKGCINHTPGFTAIVGTEESHKLGIEAAKGMALAGWRILADGEVAARVRDEFEKDKKLR
jgi:metal-dependent amidase/aminoacylase/carboxypeptidase family protein